ncbi:MAG: 3-methyl-2-oxobutanoate hydroxymethyltransferase [Verrucomicrobiia bacterium Tous-C2TDCM]|nr:MAG: 3-methyl-2-oxobutanoate hydroxymethyltransferase [Verrucomicrobiae bacterium Tous-C2TDCM]
MKSLSPSSFADRLSPPISAITAYDYPTARLCDEAGVQLILVGDSLGMMVAGGEDTTSVTLEQMVYHTTIVRRGVTRAVVVADLPIHSYDSPIQALASAGRLVEAGADAVKLEGGFEQMGQVEALVGKGFQVCGHLGMLPQHVREEGGYRKKGRSEAEAKSLVEAAVALESAGVFAIVLESVVEEVAAEVTARLRIPTIGIGSGHRCGGQVRVVHDVTGAFPWFVPPFAKTHGNVAEVTRQALSAFLEEVLDSHRTGFPD